MYSQCRIVCEIWWTFFLILYGTVLAALEAKSQSPIYNAIEHLFERKHHQVGIRNDSSIVYLISKPIISVYITECDRLALVYDKYRSTVFNQKTHYVCILLLDQNTASVYIMTGIEETKPVQISQEPTKQGAAVEGAILQSGWVLQWQCKQSSSQCIWAHILNVVINNGFSISLTNDSCISKCSKMP